MMASKEQPDSSLVWRRGERGLVGGREGRQRGVLVVMSVVHGFTSSYAHNKLEVIVVAD